jgi:putative pyruvate formate lyase activating enzyme
MSYRVYPRYLNLKGELHKRVQEGYNILKRCTLCGWKCGKNRFIERGICGGGLLPMVSSYNLHFGEEPSISGSRGSGTIFFTGCSLSCVFCQNYPISQYRIGKEISIERLAEYMLSLQYDGAHNINLVTPTHYVPQILASLEIAIEKGLSIPIVYNTGGYDSVHTLELLQGIVDIYLPDAKYSKDELALRYSGIKNYVGINKRALYEMYSQVGNLVTDDGIARSGIFVRHLVLPSHIENAKGVLQFLKSVSPDIKISLMGQYFPCNHAKDYPEINRKLSISEYREAISMMYSLSLEGYIQECITN